MEMSDDELDRMEGGKGGGWEMRKASMKAEEDSQQGGEGVGQQAALRCCCSARASAPSGSRASAARGDEDDVIKPASVTPHAHRQHQVPTEESHNQIYIDHFKE